MTGYELSRQWFDFAFENPEKINPNHTAMYFFAIEHCNRLGWKKKFGFPSTMVMEAMGIKSYKTYKKTLDDLVDLGFFLMVEKSRNQYSSNIIALVENDKAQDKALDKALAKHGTKQVQSKDSIDKQYNKEPYNKERGVIAIASDVPNTSDSETWQSAIRISNRLLESILEYDSTHRYNRNEPSLKGWVKDIDKAIRLDGRTEEQLNFIIDYIFQHNGKHSAFWAGNIESGKKLRSQFDKIKNQIKDERNKTTGYKVASIRQRSDSTVSDSLW